MSNRVLLSSNIGIQHFFREPRIGLLYNHCRAKTLNLAIGECKLHKKWNFPLRVSWDSRSFLQISSSHLLKKSLMENFNFLCSDIYLFSFSQKNISIPIMMEKILWEPVNGNLYLCVTYFKERFYICVTAWKPPFQKFQSEFNMIRDVFRIQSKDVIWSYFRK